MEEFSPKVTTSTTNPESSTPPTSAQSPVKRGSRGRRVSAALRRFGSEWNGIFSRIVARATCSDAEVLDLLFSSSDDEFIERIPRPGKCCKVSPAEAEFLEACKMYSSLEEYHTSSQMNVVVSKESPKPENSDMKFYEALDCSYLRGKSSSGSDIEKKAVRLTSEESKRKAELLEKDENIGNALWEIRRARWLSSDECDDVEMKVDVRAAASPIKQIPKKLLPRIYRDFVEKGKTLKSDKRINLEDMMVIINTGWIHEKVWEAASNGLG